MQYILAGVVVAKNLKKLERLKKKSYVCLLLDVVDVVVEVAVREIKML